MLTSSDESASRARTRAGSCALLTPAEEPSAQGKHTSSSLQRKRSSLAGVLIYLDHLAHLPISRLCVGGAPRIYRYQRGGARKVARLAALTTRHRARGDLHRPGELQNRAQRCILWGDLRVFGRCYVFRKRCVEGGNAAVRERTSFSMRAHEASGYPTEPESGMDASMDRRQPGIVESLSCIIGRLLCALGETLNGSADISPYAETALWTATGTG